MGKMTVYHGSYTAVKKPEILKRKEHKRFWPGLLLYCYPGAGRTLGQTLRQQHCQYLHGTPEY